MSGDLLEDLLSAEDHTSFSDEELKKLAPLQNEIDLIDSPNIQAFVKAILYNADTFWKAPSSNIDGFHPPDEMVEGGAILHTQRVVRIARVICRSQERSQHELDIITAAALIHDITKGLKILDEYNYDPMHPYTVDHFVSLVMMSDAKHNVGQYNLSSPNRISDDDCAIILRLVRCHMGLYSPIPETFPITPMDWIVHYADVIATQLHVIVDGEDFKEWRWVEPKPRRRPKVSKEDPPPK